MIDIDGSRGEGGGQILRTSLALSIITGKPLHMHRIRAGRAKPGLRRQHLACVEAAARICSARTEGARVGSQELTFEPSAGYVEHLDIDIGSAGSTSLVIQTILVPAIAASHSGRGLTFTVSGGTHNPMAPPFDFLARVFAPYLHAMGAHLELTLEAHGFATGGGGRDSHDDVTARRGRIRVAVHPSRLQPIEIVDAGPVVGRRATAILSQLPTHVGDRELGRIRERLDFKPEELERVELTGAIANVLMIEVEREHPSMIVRELVTAFGEKGLRAELVADRACDDMAVYLGANVPVGEHLADQLLLPMAVAGGGKFRCAPLSLHATTNIDTIRLFLDVPIRVEETGANVVVTVG